MLTRSIETKRVYSRLALATVAMLAMSVATLSAPGAAQAKEGPVADAPAAAPSVRDGDVTSDQVTGSLIVAADLPDPEPGAWDGFRQSMAGAATSSCLDPDALPHQEFEAQGLLRLPFLVRAAADGACR